MTRIQAIFLHRFRQDERARTTEPTCVTCSPSCRGRNPSPHPEPCYRLVANRPAWHEVCSKGPSPPYVNSAVCGTFTSCLLISSYAALGLDGAT